MFLHDAILDSVTCGDTQVTAADLRMMIKKYGKVDPITGLTGFQSQFFVSFKLCVCVCGGGGGGVLRYLSYHC